MSSNRFGYGGGILQQKAQSVRLGDRKKARDHPVVEGSSKTILSGAALPGLRNADLSVNDTRVSQCLTLFPAVNCRAKGGAGRGSRQAPRKIAISGGGPCKRTWLSNPTFQNPRWRDEFSRLPMIVANVRVNCQASVRWYRCDAAVVFVWSLFCDSTSGLARPAVRAVVELVATLIDPGMARRGCLSIANGEPAASAPALVPFAFSGC
jgi:hypothetical protein